MGSRKSSLSFSGEREPDSQHEPPALVRDRRGLFMARLRDRRFWFVQSMIVVVTALYGAFELTEPDSLARLYFVPASLYLFPVLYASLNFGIEGALPTALWSTALAGPLALSNSGVELAGESFEVATMLLLAVLVAIRVDREAFARRAAEESESERRLSESRYRQLFEGASEAVLLMNSSGLIVEANAAAAALLEQGNAALRSSSLGGLLGASAKLGAQGQAGRRELGDVSLRRLNGDEVWVQPVLSSVDSVRGPNLTQVLLRDVTERHGLQRYAREIVKAQESERQRIAQELHDVSVQSAILICRQLDAAMEGVEQSDSRGTATSIQQARHTAESMADELRRFSRDLRPLILDDLGLVPALRRLVVELQERSEVHVEVEVKGRLRRLDPAIELALFRIAQEALRNLESHADSTRSVLRLSYRKVGARLSVTDNGAGFVVPRLSDLVGAGRLGLLGMQERARLVGGTCSIQSTPGGGTKVTADVPSHLPFSGATGGPD